MKELRNITKSTEGFPKSRWEVHEIIPVKFGGSSTDIMNKIILPADYHRKVVTPWWNGIMKSM